MTKAPSHLRVIWHNSIDRDPAHSCCCAKVVESRLRRSLLQLSDRVGRRVQRWPEGSWPDAMQRSPRRVRSTAKDVIKSTAQAAVGLGRRAARLGMESIKRASNR